jgi:hypothetical protein
MQNGAVGNAVRIGPELLEAKDVHIEASAVADPNQISHDPLHSAHLHRVDYVKHSNPLWCLPRRRCDRARHPVRR